MAGIYSSLGESKKSNTIYKSLVYKTSDKIDISDACIFLSQYYENQYYYSKAIKVLNFCKKKSSSSLIDFQMAKISFIQEYFKKAKKYLNLTLKKNKDHYQSIILLGEILESENKMSDLFLLYKNFLARNPNNHLVLGRYINLLFVDNKYAEIIPYLENLLKMDRANLNLMVRLGILYTEIGEIQYAKRTFEEILEKAPYSNKILYYLGNLYEKTGDNEKAMSFFSKITESESFYEEAQVQITYLLNKIIKNASIEKKHLLEKRLISFISRVSKKTEKLNVGLNLLLANHFDQNQEYNKAINTLVKIKDKKAFSKTHYYYLGDLYKKVKDYKNMKNIFKEIMKKFPHKIDVLNFIGYSLLETDKNLDEAYLYIKKGH